MFLFADYQTQNFPYTIQILYISSPKFCYLWVNICRSRVYKYWPFFLYLSSIYASFIVFTITTLFQSLSQCSSVTGMLFILRMNPYYFLQYILLTQVCFSSFLIALSHLVLRVGTSFWALVFHSLFLFTVPKIHIHMSVVVYRWRLRLSA